jgi:hypothetical protein
MASIGRVAADDVRVLGQPDQGPGGDRHAGPVRDVVEQRGQTGRIGYGPEVPQQPGLRGLVVVRRDDEQAVGARLLGGAGQLDGVRGVVGAHPGHDPGPVADRLDDSPEQPVLLRVGGRRGLAAGPADHQGVVALHVDQIGGQLLCAVHVERAVRAERGHHGGQQPSEGPRGVVRHTPQLI